MHDSDLPTFLIISLPIIFNRTVVYYILSCALKLLWRFVGALCGHTGTAPSTSRTHAAQTIGTSILLTGFRRSLGLLAPPMLWLSLSFHLTEWINGRPSPKGLPPPALSSCITALSSPSLSPCLRLTAGPASHPRRSVPTTPTTFCFDILYCEVPSFCGLVSIEFTIQSLHDIYE